MGSNPGPWTSQVVNSVVEWQLEHPDGTKAECESWLKAEKDAGRIRVGENISTRPVGKRSKVMADRSNAKKVKATC